ncbi:MAG: ABC transporter substrate-binding protein [Desulfuromonadia bacterium]
MRPIFLRLLLIPLLVSLAAPTFGVARRPIIGCILTADTPHYQKLYASFVNQLVQRGYDRQRIEIYLQTPNPDQISWANAARKLKGLDVDLIVAFGGPAAVAAFREVREIPMVYLDVYGPVENGLTRSMSMSGNHATGVSSKVPLLTLLKGVAETKSVKTIGIIASSREAGSAVQANDARRSAAQLGMSVRDLTILTSSDIDTTLPRFLKGVDALFLTEAVIIQKQLDRIVKRATEAHIPVVSVTHDAASRGALLTISPDEESQSEQAAEMVTRVLSGTHPGRIPIESPRKVDLTVNMKTARTLDLVVPFPLLSNVTKVIK